MPRKPKVDKQTIQVIVNGKPVAVTLHPPTTARRSWYAYWAGLVASKSTGQTKLEDAIIAAEAMVKNGGKMAVVADAVLSDEEFEAIQRAHFGRKTDPAAQLRAKQTLDDCLEAIGAFSGISGLKPITLASPDDCAAFQRQALVLPKNWRQKYPNSKGEVEKISPNTILKWSRALQAAFERTCRNAGRKVVRGLVDDKKLLNENPWKQFNWIEGKKKPIRQFDGQELVSLLNHFEEKWPGITVATLLAKVSLWSWGRRAEITGLRWDALRQVGGEHHFEIVGKWAVEKWFRVPEAVYQDLLKIKTDSPYVFGAYTQQLRRFYEGKNEPSKAHLVCTEFRPINLGDWFYERILAWSEKLPRGKATSHVFRKTSLQYARSGEDVNRLVAEDSRLTERVMMTNYVKETDEQMRQKSNRMYQRILVSLDGKVAERYGAKLPETDPLKEKIKKAVAAEDWEAVSVLGVNLRKRERHHTG